MPSVFYVLSPLLPPVVVDAVAVVVFAFRVGRFPTPSFSPFYVQVLIVPEWES